MTTSNVSGAQPLSFAEAVRQVPTTATAHLTAVVQKVRSVTTNIFSSLGEFFTNAATSLLQFATSRIHAIHDFFVKPATTVQPATEHSQKAVAPVIVHLSESITQPAQIGSPVDEAAAAPVTETTPEKTRMQRATDAVRNHPYLAAAATAGIAMAVIGTAVAVNKHEIVINAVSSAGTQLSSLANAVGTKLGIAAPVSSYSDYFLQQALRMLPSV